MKDQAKLKFTIPDGTPEEQIKHIESIRSVVLIAGKLTGEKVDVKVFDDAIKKLSSPKGEERKV